MDWDTEETSPDESDRRRVQPLAVPEVLTPGAAAVFDRQTAVSQRHLCQTAQASQNKPGIT